MIIPRCDHPEYLALALLALPLLWLGWRALEAEDALRKTVILFMRTALLVALAVMLAGPHLDRSHHNVTVIGVLDISSSVQRFWHIGQDQPSTNASSPSPAGIGAMAVGANRQSSIDYLRRWFRQAVKLKEPDDRFGLIVFDGQSIAVSVPSASPDYTDDNLDVPMKEGTNIAEALRLGLAMFPADTAKRLVLVTDGNETAGNALDAARQAAAGSDLAFSTLDSGLTGSGAKPQSKIQNPKSRVSAIPIDVLPIAYHVTGDVQIVRVESPATAQPHQTVTVRVVMESTGPASGTLTLKREGVIVDLNGTQPGTSRHIDIPQGQSVQIAQVMLGDTPVNRLEATFEADDARTNALLDNDRAEAFTATPSKGSVLIVDRQANRRPGALAQMLRDAKIPVTTQTPNQFPDDLLSLQNYDLIVLDDIAAAELATSQQELIAKYVTDLGGGLIMTGGENNFGAGGWNHTPVAEILPIELEPPKELRLPTAALVLVLDKSGSMRENVAGARASQQEVANEGAALAIQSLRSDSLVAVLTFDVETDELIPLQRNDDPKRLAKIVRGIVPDGGTNMEPAFRRALDILKDANVNKKRVVCMTDGKSMGTDASMEAVAHEMAAANIQLTTIAVGDDTDQELLKKLSEIGGGQFYPVRDPRILPRVLVDSVQVINKPLIKEVPFTPRVLSTGSTLTAGMEQSPPLAGLVITGPRNDARVSLEMLDQSNEPLLAQWQIGLGRVAAFTSQTPGGGSGKWASQWIDWSPAATFWTQLVRTISRPAMSQDAELITTIQDDRLLINMELTGDETRSSYAQVEGTVYSPDGRSTPVKLHQTAPGRFEGAVDAPQSGNYIVALNPREGLRRLSPVIGGASKSTSPEFRKYQSNLGLLEQIVETTGGRRLDVNDPKAVDLFDRRSLPWSVSSLPAWRWVLWLAIGVMLLDIASRRIAWNEESLRSAVRRAIAKVTPAHVRGAKAAATLATLRKVSDEVDERRVKDAAGIEKFESTGEIMPPPDHVEIAPSVPQGDDAKARAIEQRTVKTVPDEGRVSAALDVLLGRKSAEKPRPNAPQPPPADANKNPSETTSGLFAAKRRAQKQMKTDPRKDN